MRVNLPTEVIKKCSKCKIILTPLNAFSCDIKNKNYLCKIHSREAQNKCHIRRMIKVYRNGKQITLYGNKRSYPEFNRCEICYKQKSYILDYHHWNDLDISKGIWLCNRCHRIVEGFENIFQNFKLILKYIIKKIKINGTN